MAKDVIMPALGMAQETGTRIQWFKSAGDSVRKGRLLMKVKPDKATVEIEAPAINTRLLASPKALRRVPPVLADLIEEPLQLLH